MKILLKNLGPISEWSCDLDKDLLFIYGKNNIGKSYAISIVYLILKNFAFDNPIPHRYFFQFNRMFNFDDHLPEDIRLKLSEGNNEFDITNTITTKFNKFIQLMFVEKLELSIKNSYGSVENLNNRLSGLPFEINLSFENFSITLINDGKNLVIGKIDFYKKILIRKIQVHRKPKFDNDKITIYSCNNVDRLEADLGQFMFSMHWNATNEIISRVRNVYYLPASRSGLYRALNAFSQILAELATKRTFLKNRIELPSISEPDLDYFSKLNEIRNRKQNEDYLEIAQIIENKLLNGEVVFETSTKKIVFKPFKTDMKLEVVATSSMIAEVSPIVIYLKNVIGNEDDGNRKRHTADSKAMIFIEEPEAHLHPEAQIELMNIFGELIKKDVILVITSHSNYMFNKLNNMIIDNKLQKDRIRCLLLSSSSSGSTASDLGISKLGIDDMNFSDVAEKLYDEKISILENINAGA